MMEDTPLAAIDTHILQAALPTAFMLGHTHRQSASLSNTQLGSSGEVTLKSQDPIHPGSPTESTTSMSSDDSWKREYEKQVQSWRAQSAEAREKAEKGRVQWEAIRAEEHVDAVRRSAAGLPSQQLDHDPVWEGAGPEKILESSILHTTTSTTSPNLEGRKEFMSGEVHPPENAVPEVMSNVPASNRHRKDNSSEAGKLSISQKWENATASPTASFPSMSFPENSRIPSPDPSHPPALPAPPLSATLAIFDKSLSTRARVSAVFSSLAVNMLLPFVNGVMLGFGEIFAKTVVVGWFGWKIPGSVVTNVGVGGSRRSV